MIRDAAKHRQALRISSRITQNVRQMYWPGALMIKPQAVIRVLNRAGVRFVLVGNYGITGWRGEERATLDVDVLVQKSHLRKAVRAIRQGFPRLKSEDYPAVTRFLDPGTGKVVIDVMKPADAVYQAVFKNTVMIGRTHRIPDLEMALVCKYAAMISSNRLESKKHTDAGDFIEIVKHNYAAIDFAKLQRLGELIYSGGGTEIMQLVEDANAERRLEF